LNKINSIHLPYAVTSAVRARTVFERWEALLSERRTLEIPPRKQLAPDEKLTLLSLCYEMSILIANRCVDDCGGEADRAKRDACRGTFGDALAQVGARHFVALADGVEIKECNVRESEKRCAQNIYIHKALYFVRYAVLHFEKKKYIS